MIDSEIGSKASRILLLSEDKVRTLTTSQRVYSFIFASAFSIDCWAKKRIKPGDPAEVDRKLYYRRRFVYSAKSNFYIFGSTQIFGYDILGGLRSRRCGTAKATFSNASRILTLLF